MKSLAEFSVKNPLLINAFSVIFLISGIYAVFFMLNREAFPNINFDVVTVTTTYPGSTPEEIEKLITIPIEKELKQVDDIDEISSVSAEGMSVITLKLEETAKNKNQIVNDIQRAVEKVEDLPDDLPDKPIVTELRTKDAPVIEVSLTGDISEADLRFHARNIEDLILDFKDTSKVVRKGYRDRQIWVEVSPQSIAQNYIGLEEIATALAGQNRTIPGGKIYIDNNEYVLRTSGEYKNTTDVGDTVIRAQMGSWLQIKDVAKVTDGFEEETSLRRTRGTSSITLTVIKKENGDTIDLVEDVRMVVANYLKSHPEVKASFVNDISFYIKRRLNVLINNGTIGLGLVAVSLFIFLSPSTALSACLGIPTALLMTATFMGVFDVSINLISLFGLIMVLGMLVDEDIVITENIHHNLESGMDPDQAAITGAREVSGAVVTTVLTTIVAFVPILLMGGIMGKFTADIPKVVMITLTCSLIEALIILPSHIREITHMMHSKSQIAKSTAKKKTSKALSALEHFYMKFLKHALHHRYIYSLVLMLAFLGSLYTAVTHMKFILFPAKGVEQFFVRVEAQPGDSLEITSSKIKPIEQLILDLPENELDTFTTFIGLVQNDPNDPFTNRSSNVAQIQVYLTPESNRTRSSQEIIEALRPLTEQIPGFVKVSFDQFRNGPPVGKPVQIRTRGDDFKTLEEISDAFKELLANIDGVTDIKDDYEVGKKEKRVVVDPVKSAQAGLSVTSVANSIRAAFEGLRSTSIKSTEEETDILVKFPLEFRHDSKALELVMIPNGKGRLIPLAQVASFVPDRGVQSIKHFDNDRTINVTANVNEDIVSPIQIVEKIKPHIASLTKKYPGYRIDFAGEAEDTQESLRNLGMAFLISFCLILVILIAMFRSLSQTLIVMFTIPFSVIGVIIAFMLHNEPISFMSLLGIIALTGIVVDGATILIDFINRYHEQGMTLVEAIHKSCSRRLRSVVLTSLTTVLGVIPSTYGFGGSDPFITPMAMAINYGIVFSTILTLVYIPIFLLIWDEIKTKFSRKNSQNKTGLDEAWDIVDGQEH